MTRNKKLLLISCVVVVFLALLGTIVVVVIYLHDHPTLIDQGPMPDDSKARQGVNLNPSPSPTTSLSNEQGTYIFSNSAINQQLQQPVNFSCGAADLPKLDLSGYSVYEYGSATMQGLAVRIDATLFRNATSVTSGTNFSSSLAVLQAMLGNPAQAVPGRTDAIDKLLTISCEGTMQLPIAYSQAIDYHGTDSAVLLINYGTGVSVVNHTNLPLQIQIISHIGDSYSMILATDVNGSDLLLKNDLAKCEVLMADGTLNIPTAANADTSCASNAIRANLDHTKLNALAQDLLNLYQLK